MRDSLDHKLDISYYLSDLHGFMPVPAIISEPALGNFGIALAPVFISPQKSTSNKDRFHFPNITALLGLYTANKSWATGAFHMGSYPKWGLRYRLGGAYGKLNLNFYRTLPVVGEEEFKFNFEMKAALLELSKDIYKNRIFAGFSYIFANSLIGYSTLYLPQSIFDNKDMNSKIGNLGLFIDVDYRNSIFTADKGLRVKTNYMVNRPFTGSDYTFDRLEFFAHLFLMPSKRWVCAFRADGSALTGEAPFYAYPFVYLRGIPMLRYQGKQTITLETEQRIDVTKRWSIVAFVGSGKAFREYEMKDFEEKWNWSGGLGFRYLISRLFKLRIGVDVAKGPENFAYYIVFGHSWNR